MEKTLINLAKAFIWETQARNRYNMYASIARKQWYLQIAEIFEKTAEQEREHAWRFFKMIQQLEEKSWKKVWELTIETQVPILRSSTSENLWYAISGESHEFESMYPEFARIAQEEWLQDIALRIRSIARAEQHHAERYQKLKKELDQETLYSKPEEIAWICDKCGYEHTDKNPPKICPSCGHEHNYFQVKCETY
jgi:rubrerythrin